MKRRGVAVVLLSIGLGLLPLPTRALEARVVAGITQFATPTVVHGGITLVGMLAKGTAGFAPGYGQEARRLQAWRLTQPGRSVRQLGGDARRQRAKGWSAGG